MMDHDLTKMRSITLVGKLHLYAMVLALKEKGFDVLVCDTDSLAEGPDCATILRPNQVLIDELQTMTIKSSIAGNYIETIVREPKQKAQWKRERYNRRR